MRIARLCKAVRSDHLFFAMTPDVTGSCRRGRPTPVPLPPPAVHDLLERPAGPPCRRARRPRVLGAVADGDGADRHVRLRHPELGAERRDPLAAGCRRSRRRAPRRPRSAGSAARPSRCRCASRAPASGAPRGPSSPCRPRRSGRGRRPCATAARPPPARCASRSASGSARRSSGGVVLAQNRATSAGRSSTRNAQPWLNPALGARTALAQQPVDDGRVHRPVGVAADHPAACVRRPGTP